MRLTLLLKLVNVLLLCGAIDSTIHSTIAFANIADAVKTAGEEALVISNLLNKKVIVEDGLRKQLVFVRSNGCSPDLVLTSFVSCLHASVSMGPDGYYVRRSSEDLRKIASAAMQEKASWIARSLALADQFRKNNLNPADPSAGVEAEYLKESSELQDATSGKGLTAPKFRGSILMPAGKFLLELVRRIGPQVLAAHSGPPVSVFEDEPRLGASPLPPHADLDSNLVADSPSYEKFTGGRLPGANSPDIFPDLRLGALTATSGLSPARARLEQLVYDNRILFVLDVYGQQGNRIATASLVCESGTNSYDTPVKMIRSAESSGADPKWRMLTAAGIAAAAFAARPGIQAFPTWFSRPDLHEPMNLFVSTALNEVASENPSKCFAIEVTDSLWLLARQCIRENQISIEGVRWALAEIQDYERLDSERTVVWRPRDPQRLELRQADRAELARFAQRSSKSGCCDFRSTAELYAKGSKEPGSLTNLWEFFAQVSLARWTTDGKNLTARMYQLAGAISDDNWLRLMSGEALTCGQLGVTAQLKALLIGNAAVEQATNEPIPDLYRHPTETYLQAEQLAETQISVRPVLTRLIQLAPMPSGKNFWTSQFSTSGEPALPSHIIVQPTPSGGKIVTTRQEFEDRMSARHYRLGEADGVSILIRLPRSEVILAECKAFATPTSETLAYGDFSQEYRDLCWESAYRKAKDRADAMSRAVDARENPLKPKMAIPISQP